MKRLIFIIVTLVGMLGALGFILALTFQIPEARERLMSHFPAAGHSAETGEWRVTAPVKIWRNDPTFGYVHIPDHQGVHFTDDFTATYTIGPEGERLIPQPEHPIGHVAFLGGSFTFGEGVDDHEPFSYLLSQRWKEYSVKNYGVMAWGTSHAWLKTRELLEKEPRPSIIFYGMIPHHIQRNYIRKDWVDTMTRYGRGHPHFELIEGVPVFQGLVDPEKTISFSMKFQETEIQLTKAFLVSMHRACRDQGVRFILIYLNRRPPDEISDFVDDSGIELIDLSSVPIEGFESDPHPTPTDHQRVAEALFEAISF